NGGFQGCPPLSRKRHVAASVLIAGGPTAFAIGSAHRSFIESGPPPARRRDRPRPARPDDHARAATLRAGAASRGSPRRATGVRRRLASPPWPGSGGIRAPLRSPPRG